MSAEVENGKEEEVKVEKVKKPLRKKILAQYPTIIKAVELVVCLICMGTIYDPISYLTSSSSHITSGSFPVHHLGVMYTAYTGYIVITCVLLVSRALGDKIPYRTVALFAVVGSALFLTTGILLFVDRATIIKNVKNKQEYYPNYSDSSSNAKIVASAGFALLNMLIFAADAVLTFIFQEDL